MLLLADVAQAPVHVVVDTDCFRYLLPGGFSGGGKDAHLVGFFVLSKDVGIHAALPVAACSVPSVMADVERLVSLWRGRPGAGDILIRIHVHGCAEDILPVIRRKCGIFFLCSCGKGQHHGNQKD